ncbi:MAG: hypothetical protein P8Q41_16405 [Saprospiraceae bacterium]|nr:hypothetical protein [Saprospiraceae bacterium]
MYLLIGDTAPAVMAGIQLGSANHCSNHFIFYKFSFSKKYINL